MTSRHPSRQRHRGAHAQAVVEMAMVMPIFLVLIAYFLAVMVEVRTRSEVTAATSLAAQSSLAAPVNDPRASCAYATESFYATLYSTTSGMANAVNTCNGLLQSTNTSKGPSSFSPTNLSPPTSQIVAVDSSADPLVGSAPGAGFVCDSSQKYVVNVLKLAGYPIDLAGGGGPASYYNGVNYPVDLTLGTGPPVVCAATVIVSFANSPLSFAVRWTSNYTIVSLATPSNVRQCSPLLNSYCGP